MFYGLSRRFLRVTWKSVEPAGTAGGSDSLFGGPGSDFLDGGPGTNHCDGDGGHNVLVNCRT
ncbi:hypothetical protein [Streptomyces sp. NPDC052107]|uniref:hypothetical protein n=1 Tax=Streptomyces sp. NPDC052107 TaxID=3155632 RepID=UPI00341D8116